MRPYGSPEELERRRRKAVSLLYEGFQPVEIARMLGVDRRSVRRWKAAWLARGQEGIRSRPASGRPPKLDVKARKKLEGELLKGAGAAGFPTDLWTCPRVAELILRRFGVRYHPDHVCRLLRGMGFSPQRPQRRAAERDEGEIRRWVKEEWPRVKKKPRA
jgi:transposase